MTNQLDNMAVILAKRPEGLPNPDDFTLEDRPLGDRPSGQVRCQTLYLSLDPYMRSVIAGSHMGHGIDPGDVVAGEVVARVVDSDDPDGRVGTVGGLAVTLGFGAVSGAGIGTYSGGFLG